MFIECVVLYDVLLFISMYWYYYVLLFINYDYMLLFMIMCCSNLCYTNGSIFTCGYPFTLSGDGYMKKLYPLTDVGTGDG